MVAGIKDLVCWCFSSFNQLIRLMKVNQVQKCLHTLPNVLAPSIKVDRKPGWGSALAPSRERGQVSSLRRGLD